MVIRAAPRGWTGAVRRTTGAGSPRRRRPLAEVIAHAVADLRVIPNLDTLAARGTHEPSHLRPPIPRTHRQFSPLQWLQHQRILHARRLLEDSELSVDAVAREVGLANAVSLRPHFRRLVGTSPQRYRETFRSVTQ